MNIDLRKAESYLVVALRVSLAIVFFWFGALKVFGFNPVNHIVAATFPIFGSETGSVILGAVEAIIGIGLLINIVPIVTHLALIFHLSGTMITFFVAPSLMFMPYFPILSIEGEFVVKNIVLAMAGIVVLIHERRKKMYKF